MMKKESADPAQELIKNIKRVNRKRKMQNERHFFKREEAFDEKMSVIKQISGTVCICIAIFIFFTPFTFANLPIIYTVFTFVIPFISALLLIFVVPKNPILLLFAFYFFLVSIWFFVLSTFSSLSEVEQNIKAEHYFYILFPLFMAFFVIGNYLYTKSSVFYSYTSFILLLILFWTR